MGGFAKSGSKAHSRTLMCLWDDPSPPLQLPRVGVCTLFLTVRAAICAPLWTRQPDSDERLLHLWTHGPVPCPAPRCHISWPASCLRSSHAAEGVWPEGFLSLGGLVGPTRKLCGDHQATRSERGASFTLLHLVVNEMRGGYGVKQQQNVYEEKCKFVFSFWPYVFSPLR